eukprot:Rhum_TRINITY_DN16712_c0_g1::Rhum_TRINITY_DN16712_c0_g1_i1::g.164149::m.164149
MTMFDSDTESDREVSSQASSLSSGGGDRAEYFVEFAGSVEPVSVRLDGTLRGIVSAACRHFKCRTRDCTLTRDGETIDNLNTALCDSEHAEPGAQFTLSRAVDLSKFRSLAELFPVDLDPLVRALDSSDAGRVDVYLTSVGADWKWDEHLPIVTKAITSGRLHPEAPCVLDLTAPGRLARRDAASWLAQHCREMLVSGRCPQDFSLCLRRWEYGPTLRAMGAALASGACPRRLHLDLGNLHNPDMNVRPFEELVTGLLTCQSPPEFLRLDLDGVLRDECCGLLGTFLQSPQCPASLELNLATREITSAGVKRLCEGLRQRETALQYLKMSFDGSHVCDEGLTPLAAVMMSDKCPKTLSLRLTSFVCVTDSVSAIAAALESGHQEHVEISFVGSGGTEFDSLARSLGSGRCPPCLSLSLVGCGIGDKTASRFAEALRSGQIPQEITLNLVSNSIGNAGSSALCKALTAVPQSTRLSLNLKMNEGMEKCLQWTKDIRAALSSGRCPTHLDLQLPRTSESGYRNIGAGYSSPQCPSALVLDNLTARNVKEVQGKPVGTLESIYLAIRGMSA